jgi:hypothetical protein
LADALQRAQEILWDCEKAGLRSPEVGALYARIESIHADVRMLQAQALNARRDETDPKRTHLPPWRKASD